MVMDTIWFLGGLVGIPVIGKFNIAPVLMVKYIGLIVLLNLALTSIMVCISVNVSNKTVSIAAQVLISFILVVISFILYSKVVMISVDESTKKLFITIMNMTPAGQGFILIHSDTLDKVPRSFMYQAISSSVITLYFLMTGIDSFYDRDIK